MIQTNDLKALHIATCEFNNVVLDKNNFLCKEIHFCKNIISQLTNPESLLSKIIKYANFENSWKLQEALLDSDFLKNECDNKFDYTDLVETIPYLKYLGFHIIEFDNNNYYGLKMLYIDWKKNICPMEKELAIRYNNKIHYPISSFKPLSR